MARIPQMPRLPSAVPLAQSAPRLSPHAPLIPLQAVWTSLTPPQQQRLLHQLVCLCCGLLRTGAARSTEEATYDAR
jgi:hypothetical protein